MRRFNIPGRVSQNSTLPPTNLFDSEGLVGIDANGDADTPARQITDTALVVDQDIRIAADVMTYRDSGATHTVEVQAHKGVASGYASLDAGVKVVENPASATATPTAASIPISDGAGKLAAGWGGSASTLATLDAGVKVVENPANAQEAGGAGKIPLGDAGGKLASSWGGSASTLATLDAGSKVVENPASATATPTAASIPISDGANKLDIGWLPTASASGLATLDASSELVQLPPALQGRTVVVPLTLAQLKTMYTTPELLISSPGANKAIIVDSIVFEANRTGTAISGGGAISIKYASGADVCATIAAALLTGAAGTEIVRRLPVDAAAASANISANALVITNADAVFADGAGTESANVWIQYRIISTTA
ncbi:MAG: hypothetical protein EOM25_10910 [Deltaproteobacteria bacterium]|nr:hypothetical protein [Deltaproteobacteria bacterium]